MPGRLPPPRRRHRPRPLARLPPPQAAVRSRRSRRVQLQRLAVAAAASLGHRAVHRGDAQPQPAGDHILRPARRVSGVPEPGDNAAGDAAAAGPRAAEYGGDVAGARRRAAGAGVGGGGERVGGGRGVWRGGAEAGAAGAAEMEGRGGEDRALWCVCEV